VKKKDPSDAIRTLRWKFANHGWWHYHGSPQSPHAKNSED